MRNIKPTHKPIKTFYAELKQYEHLGATNGLIDFGQRHGHYGVINLSDGEYERLDDVLEKLIYSVGENQSPP